MWLVAAAAPDDDAFPLGVGLEALGREFFFAPFGCGVVFLTPARGREEEEEASCPFKIDGSATCQ